MPVPLIQVSILISLEPRGPVLQTRARCASSETSRTSCLPHPHRPLSSGIAKSSLVFLRDNCLLPQAPARNMKKEASVKHSYLKSECAILLGRVWTGTSVSASGSAAIFTARQWARCSHGGGLLPSATRCTLHGGRPSCPGAPSSSRCYLLWGKG